MKALRTSQGLFLNYFFMEKNPKALISDLINMVKADGKIKTSEVKLIRKVAMRMGLSMQEISLLFEMPQSSKTLFNEVDRITHFYRLALVMRVDNEIHNSEIAALKTFALKMGIRPIVTDQIMKKMGEYADGLVPPEDLLKIFKIYYN